MLLLHCCFFVFFFFPNFCIVDALPADTGEQEKFVKGRWESSE